VLVTVADGDVERLTALAERHGVPVATVGRTGGGALVVDGQFDIELSVLRDTWTRTLPDALGA
jgi:phosphoribosylformylglycinamidine synthase